VCRRSTGVLVMGSDEHLEITTTVESTTARVALVGELDVVTASRVSDELVALAGQDVKSVVVDVSELTFIDSTGLRALLAGREKLHATTASFVLEGATGVVERVLELTGLRDRLSDES
jgi:anti-sigma B factor antagonist